MLVWETMKRSWKLIPSQIRDGDGQLWMKWGMWREMPRSSLHSEFCGCQDMLGFLLYFKIFFFQAPLANSFRWFLFAVASKCSIFATYSTLCLVIADSWEDSIREFILKILVFILYIVALQPVKFTMMICILNVLILTFKCMHSDKCTFHSDAWIKQICFPVLVEVHSWGLLWFLFYPPCLAQPSCGNRTVGRNFVPSTLTYLNTHARTYLCTCSMQHTLLPLP